MNIVFKIEEEDESDECIGEEHIQESENKSRNSTKNWKIELQC